MEKNCARKEGRPPRQLFEEKLHEEKVETFAQANSARAISDCLALTELTRLGEPKCLYGEGPARRVTLPSKKGHPARRVTLLDDPTFCFSYKIFDKFFETLARQGLFGKAGDPSTGEREDNPLLTGGKFSPR